ncbi:MAG: glycosyltransferase family 4 protein [bacterium]|nr:glycosyltransferase family 4 protein [bacterium]
MKVFHLTDHLPGYHKTWGGAEQVAYRYIKLLADSGEVEVMVGAVRPQKEVNENFKFIRIRVIEDLFPKKLHIFITGLKNQLFPFDILAFFHLLKIVRREKPDLIHLYKTNKISFSPLIVAKLLRVPIVLSIYDYWYFCPGAMLINEEGNLCKRFHGSWCRNCSAIADKGPVVKIAAFYRRPLFDLFLGGFDGFFVLSEFLGKILRAYGVPKNKIFLARQVFDLKKFPDNSSKIREGLIFWAAWFDSRKGAHVLIEAMPYILRKISNATLYLLGIPGVKGYKERLGKMIKEKKIEKNVRLYDNLRQQDEKFQEIFKYANVVVVSEQWENMSPVIIIEAMASGKPVVAGRIGGIPEFVIDQKTGFLVNYKDSKAFAEKIVKILRDKGLARKMGKAARSSIQKICKQQQILVGLIKSYSLLSKKYGKN